MPQTNDEWLDKFEGEYRRASQKIDREKYRKDKEYRALVDSAVSTLRQAIHTLRERHAMGQGNQNPPDDDPIDGGKKQFEQLLHLLEIIFPPDLPIASGQPFGHLLSRQGPSHAQSQLAPQRQTLGAMLARGLFGKGAPGAGPGPAQRQQRGGQRQQSKSELNAGFEREHMGPVQREESTPDPPKPTVTPSSTDAGMDVIVKPEPTPDTSDPKGVGEGASKREFNIKSKDPSCFIAGTSVMLADGTAKPIEQIAPGDEVASLDTGTGELVPAKVVELLVHPNTSELLTINDVIVTTPNHHFYVNGDWSPAGQLKLDDRLVVYGAVEPTSIPVGKLSIDRDKDTTTYNLHLTAPNNYFANGFLVHNALGKGSDPNPEDGTDEGPHLPPRFIPGSGPLMTRRSPMPFWLLSSLIRHGIQPEPINPFLRQRDDDPETEGVPEPDVDDGAKLPADDLLDDGDLTEVMRWHRTRSPLSVDPRLLVLAALEGHGDEVVLHPKANPYKPNPEDPHPPVGPGVRIARGPSARSGRLA